MKKHSTNHALEALLGDVKWIGGLARRLVRDAAAADDLVQDALTIAIQEPSLTLTDSRSWVATVLRNLARDRARSESRRSVREERASRPEGGGNEPSQTVLMAERQRALTDAVLALSEPYRTVVLMRWFEGLSPRAIAKKTGRPVETVKMQLQRGHGQLRLKLEGTFGDRGAWAVALLPLVGQKKLGLAGAKAGVLVAAALLAVTSFVVWGGRGEPAGASFAERHAESLAAVDAPLDAVSGSDVERAPMEAPTESAADPGHASPRLSVAEGLDSRPLDLPAMTFRGRLYDTKGVPLTPEREPDLGLRVHYEGRDGSQKKGERGPLIRPDSDGRFGVERSDQGLYGIMWFEVVGSTLTVLEIGRPVGDDEDIHVVLAPSIDVSGYVQDKNGEPVMGALVRWNADLRSLGSYPENLAYRKTTYVPRSRWTCLTAADGRFDLRSMPVSSSSKIEARDGRGRRALLSGPNASAFDLELTLSGEKEGRQFFGRVVNERGSGVEDALVRFSQWKCETSDDGTFVLTVPESMLNYVFRHEPAVLSAVAEDGRFVHLDLATNLFGPHELRIPDSMQRLAGRLLDEGGLPIGGVAVLVFNGTRIGNTSGMLEMNGPDLGRRRCRTDSSGRFKFDRLEERDYTLRFLSDDCTLMFDAPGLRPGDDEVDVRLPQGARTGRFVGRAVDIYGEPLPSVTVTHSAYEQFDDGGPRSTTHQRSTICAEDGTFTFESVSHAAGRFCFDNCPDDAFGGVNVLVESLDVAGRPDVVVELHCVLAISIPEGHSGSVEFLDEGGETVRLVSFEPNGIKSSSRVQQREDGSFPPLRVYQSAVTARVRNADRGTFRDVPICLSPLKRNVLAL